MARYNHYISSFLGGEIDPKLLGRSDTEIFQGASKLIDNFIVQPQGGVMARPGFKYIAATAVTTATTSIDFSHSSGNDYVLEFSNLKFRIFKDGVAIGAPTEITTTITTAMLPDLNYHQSGDTLYITHEDLPPQSVTRTSDTAWTIADVDFTCAPMYPLDDATYGRTELLGNTGVTVSSLSANTLGASATLVVNSSLFASGDVGKFMRIKNFTSDPDSEANASLVTTQTTADVKVQDGAVSALDDKYQTVGYDTSGVPDSSEDLYDKVDNLYIKLPLVTTSTRTTPYSSTVTTNTRVYSGSTASSTKSSPTVNTAVSTYTGSVITSETITVTGNETETWGLVKITAYTSATQVTVEIIRPLSSTNFHSTQKWQMSRFGSNTGYPRKVAFYEGRCYFANIGTGTNVLVGSKSNSIVDFENGEGEEGTLTAASALDFTLSEIRSIQWLQPSQKMIIGATNGVYSLSGTNQSGINPLNPPIFRKIVNSECSTVQPIFTQNTTFYTHANSKKVGALTYRPGEFSGFEFEDLTHRSEHLFVFGIKEWALRDGVLWVITDAGELRGLTYSAEFKIKAWHRHTMTGTINSIKSLGDDLYIFIERTIDGATTQYVEIMSDDIQVLTKEDVICVDSAFTYDSTAATVITGLDHLEGVTVDILADGANVTPKTVTSGQITLTLAASVVHLGIPYTSTINTVDIMGGNRRGSSEGVKGRINKVGLKLLNTNGALVSVTGNTDQNIKFNVNQIFGVGPALFTGTKVKSINSGSVLDPAITVKSLSALPISILGISVDIDVIE